MAEQALIGLGGATQATAIIRQGQAAKASGDFNAKVAENNAAAERAKANEDSRRFRIVSRKRIGSARAAIGASGVTLEGSALDALEEGAATAELDSLTIIQRGETKARGFESEALLSRFEGKNARANAELQASGKLFETGASILGSIG